MNIKEKNEIIKILERRKNIHKKPLKDINKVIKAIEKDIPVSTAPAYLFTSEGIIQKIVPWILSTHNEVMLYGAGINDETLSIRIPTLFTAPAVDNPSPCFVRANAFSSLKCLSYTDDYGLPLIILFHSHPGTGKGATTQSALDIRTMKIMEKNYPVIGCIFSQDLYFRFFSVASEFEVRIFGKGVNRIEDRLYQVDKAYLHNPRA